MKYRADIDGLRAIAVLSVVLYHAGFEPLKGGFIGVDIFFVISGYLICTILISEIGNQTYSLQKFYERRIRRIFPALCVVIAFVLAFAPFFLLPSHFENLPSQAIGGVFFAANIVFWRQSGYFSAEAEENPLLHLWSLGVEEQFYIFIPIALYLILRFVPGLLALGLISGFLVSFILSVMFSATEPSAAFYLLPTRAWELLAGALVAAKVIRAPQSRLYNEVLAAIGLLLLGVSIFCISSKMVFPGYVALVPVLGTVLIVLSAPGTKVGKFLSLPPMVWIGLISYSLYLWHWPLLTYGRDAGLLDGAIGKSAVVILSVCVAFLSWKYVEAPFRKAGNISQKRIFTYSAGVAATLFIVSLAYWQMDGWRARYNSTVVNYDNGRYDFSPLRSSCHFDSGLRDINEFCLLGGEAAEVAVWSDSHGVELAYAISEVTPVLQITYSACPPAPGYSLPERPSCAKHNDQILEYLTQSSISTVVMTSRYTNSYTSSAFREGFARSIYTLREAGKRVLVVGPMPTPHEHVPTSLARFQDIKYPRTVFERDNIEILPWLEELEPDSLVHPSDIFCNASECSRVIDGDPVLFDDNHASVSAARYVTSLLAKDLPLRQE